MTLLIIMSWIIYKESISHFHRIWKSSYSYPGLLFKQSQLLCRWWVCDSPEGCRSLYIYKINASAPRGLGFATASHRCAQVPWGAQSLPVALWEMLGAPRCAGGAGAFELGVLTTWAEPIPCVHKWQKIWKRKFSVSPNMVFKVFPWLINQLFRSSITKCFLAAKQLGKKMNCLSCKNYLWRWWNKFQWWNEKAFIGLRVFCVKLQHLEMLEQGWFLDMLLCIIRTGGCCKPGKTAGNGTVSDPSVNGG